MNRNNLHDLQPSHAIMNVISRRRGLDRAPPGGGCARVCMGERAVKRAVKPAPTGCAMRKFRSSCTVLFARADCRQGRTSPYEAYNPMLPTGTNGKATMMIEYSDVNERKRELARLIDCEDRMFVEVDGKARVSRHLHAALLHPMQACAFPRKSAASLQRALSRSAIRQRQRTH